MEFGQAQIAVRIKSVNGIKFFPINNWISSCNTGVKNYLIQKPTHIPFHSKRPHTRQSIKGTSPVFFIYYKILKQSINYNLYIVGGIMNYLRYLCLFGYSGVPHILCCVFTLFFFVLYIVFYYEEKILCSFQFDHCRR
jgi:hypothetical protein